MNQTEFKSERNIVMGVSIGVSVFLSSIIVLVLMLEVSGFFFLLWLPLVVVLTFMYQSLGYASEEFLRKIRTESFKEELQPWTINERLEAITAWPVVIMPLIIWYAAKGSFNLIWEDLAKEPEKKTAAEQKESKVTS